MPLTSSLQSSHSRTRIEPDMIFPIPPLVSPKFPHAPLNDLWTVKRAGVGLIQFPRFPTYVILIHQRHRQTDDMRSQEHALHYSASRGKRRLSGLHSDALLCFRQFTHTTDIPSRERFQFSTADNLFVSAVRLSTVGRRAFPVTGACKRPI